MAAEDRAILVGISRYFDRSFAPLKGPPNDVARMHEWLLSPDGGGLPSDHVHTLVSPDAFAPTLDPSDWSPGEADYQRAFRRMASDPATNAFVRRKGRLYLYFSGHGFSERRDQSTRAALYAAGATRSFPGNICGTIWALAAKQRALFEEIVLIMDCCRDAELNIPFSQPAINLGMADNAGAVRFMAVYAAPKGGKAQEREFAELNGMTCGLVTHAFLKALKETPPDSPLGVSSNAIQRYMLSTWAALCGDTPATEPQFTAPEGAELYFPAVAQGVQVGFHLANASTRQLQIDILDHPGNRLVGCTLSQGSLSVEYLGAARVAQTMANDRFSVRLQPGFYRCTVTGDVTQKCLIEADGASPDVEL